MRDDGSFTRESAKRQAGIIKREFGDAKPEIVMAGMVKAGICTLFELTEEEGTRFQRAMMEDLSLLGRYQLDLMRELGWLRDGL